MSNNNYDNRIIYISLVILLFFGCIVMLNSNNNLNNVVVVSNKVSSLENGINAINNYSLYVKSIANINIYNVNKEKIGIIYKDVEIALDDNYRIVSNYYKLKDCDYYVYYKDVVKVDQIYTSKYDEYSTYKNYLPYNINIITNNYYRLFVGNKIYYNLSGSNSFRVIIKDDDKYGVEFNGRLLYIYKSDVYREVENINTNEEVLEDLAVLNYHYTVNREALELEECDSSICMEDVQVEEEIKYLFDNKYYAMTMRDVYLFLSGKARFPKKSVAITIDDGWYVKRMIDILEKYKLTGTLFLIGSLASPSDYKSDFLEIHSHSWDMHTPGVCYGSHGGAILCWDKEDILRDLKKSRESLNNTSVFCFPFYEYNEDAIEYLKEAGFKMAFIGGDRKATIGDDLFKINRFELVNYTTMDEFIEYVN
ncbi:MAG: polysaccharide deacetylase family protein [Bacilli bacterium]|nr:polysaccharide deacetylase family protein [Bacilli bacterium]